jgi:hypothetical protein
MSKSTLIGLATLLWLRSESLVPEEGQVVAEARIARAAPRRVSARQPVGSATIHRFTLKQKLPSSRCIPKPLLMPPSDVADLARQVTPVSRGANNGVALC